MVLGEKGYSNISRCHEGRNPMFSIVLWSLMWCRLFCVIARIDKKPEMLCWFVKLELRLELVGVARTLRV